MLPSVALLLLSLPQASDWPRFRGPNGSGVAADGAAYPTQLGPETNVVWRVEVPPGHSSPVLSSDHVILTAAGQDGSLWTYAIARADGALAWKRPAPRGRETKIDPRNHPASPSAALDGERIVVFFPDFGLLAYDHSGEELWRVELGPFDNLYGMGASPVLVEDKLLLVCDQQLGSYLLCVDAARGRELWRTPRPHVTSGHCTPVLWTPEEGGPQLLVPGSFHLDAYDLAGGRVWWSKGLSCEMKSVPVVHDGVVFINGYMSPMNQPGNQISLPAFEDVLAERDADGDERVQAAEMPPGRAAGWHEVVDLDHDGGLDAGEWQYLREALGSLNGMLAIRAGGAGDRTDEALVWAHRRSVPQLPSPLVANGVLYMLNDQGGILTTFDPASGEVLAKGRIEGAQDAYYASPVAGGGHIYCVSHSGLVSVLPADGSLEPVAVHALGERCWATPALSGGRVYLRTEERLYCFGGS